MRAVRVCEVYTCICEVAGFQAAVDLRPNSTIWPLETFPKGVESMPPVSAPAAAEPV